MTPLAILLLLASPIAGLVIGWAVENWRLDGAPRFDSGLRPESAIRRFAGYAIAAFVVAAWSISAAPADTRLQSAVLGALLLALAGVDWRLRILPNPLTLAVAILGVFTIALVQPNDWLDHVLGGLIGFGALFAIEVAYRALRKRPGLGRGDAKLLGALGIWTGWAGLPGILLIASTGGLAAALVQSRLQGATLSGRTSIAFGPWLALAGWIVWLHGPFIDAP